MILYNLSFLPKYAKETVIVHATIILSLPGCTDGHLYVFEAVSGELTWQFNSGAAWLSAPVVDTVTGHVHVRNCADWFYCLNIQVGNHSCECKVVNIEKWFKTNFVLN